MARHRTLTWVSLDDVGDGDLWARACSGDGDAIVGVYGRYADRIHGYCFRRTGSWALAQDLTSTVWLEAWRRRGDIDVGKDARWRHGSSVLRTT